jgi:hypothetical protein
MLNVGPCALRSPLTRAKKAWKSGRSRNEGIPEVISLRPEKNSSRFRQRARRRVGVRDPLKIARVPCVLRGAHFQDTRNINNESCLTSRAEVHDDDAVADKVTRSTAGFMEEAAAHLD